MSTLVIAGSIALIIVFIQYIIYEKVWLEYFAVFNMFPIVVLSVIIAAAILTLLFPLLSRKTSTPRTIAAFAGIAILAVSPVLVAIQKTHAVGVAIGFIGVIGMLVLLIGNSDFTIRDGVLLSLFLIGTLFIGLVGVVQAFNLVDLPEHINLSFTMSGFLIVVVATAFIGKFMRVESKLFGYFGIWTAGLFAIMLVPFHEAIGLNASKNYGYLDQSLILAGLVCIGAAMFLAVLRRFQLARIDSYVVRGNVSQEKGDYSGAIQLYDTAIRDGRNDEVVWTNKGSVFRKIRMYNEALECFRTALAINPQYDPALVGLGNVLSKTGYFEKALECYESALALNPGNADAAIDRAILLSRMDRDDEALREVKRILRAYPRTESAWMAKAVLDRKKGDYSGEREDYLRALEIKPKNREALIGLGNVLLVLEKYDEAEEIYGKLIEEDGGNTAVWSNLGVLYTRKQNYDTAIEYFKKALENDSEYVNALVGIGYALFKKDNNEDALGYIDRALEISPNEITALVYKGEILNSRARPGDAITVYKKALEINPNLKNVIKSLADTLSSTGKNAEAQMYYAKLAEMDVTKKPVESVLPSADIKKMISQIKKEPLTAPVHQVTAGGIPVASAESATSDIGGGAGERAVQTAGAAQPIPVSRELKIERGFNYLVFEERTVETYKTVAKMLKEGVKVLCLTPTFPAKIKKEYGLQDAQIVWISESNEKEAVNPKRLEFEIARAIGNFIRGNVDPVIVIDGFEVLTLQNGYENVMKFIKKANDLASVNSATIILPLNPSSLKKEDLPLLSKEFDKIEDLTKK